MEHGIEGILATALDAVKKDSGLAALDAVQRASAAASPEDRKGAIELVRRAAMRPETGMGKTFQESILRRALLSIKSNRSSGLDPHRPSGRSASGRPVDAGIERKNVMSENENTTGSNARSKKYNVGDTFNTVATMGLQVTDGNRKPTCGYQFSRKTGRDGTMDLPEGTAVRYVGARSVYDGQASSKRMIFKVTAGTRVILNGQDTTLDGDIEIAGVVNHIDADDPYNIQARENEAKRAEKAALKAAAAAAAKATQAA